MLTISNIEKDLRKHILGLQKRGIKDAEVLLKKILKVDEERKIIKRRLDSILHESNNISKEIGQLFQQGKKRDAEIVKMKTSILKEESKKLNNELQNKETKLASLLHDIPNIPNEIVPAGQSEHDNEVIKIADSTIPKLENGKPHWELIEEYDIVDFDLGNKVTGAGFPFYKGKGARVVRGMINYFLDKAEEAGYLEVQPPVVVNEVSGFGTGQLPDKEGQMYHVERNNLYLIPTAEVPITNMYRDTILKRDDLPIKNTGHTPCFRKEAGSWGSHVRGLNRLHQFDKVEIVHIVAPEKSYEALDEMVLYVESLIVSLNLPYRILRLCAGDLGFASALTYDFEVFSAAQKKWLEVSSVSNFETYQANRLKLRIKKDDGKKVLAHTLNGSALALPRILAAILENNQKKNGIKMPEVLIPYLGFKEIMK
ncbi:MAG: serine--tRNA ligase [Bacteroidota bacterium]